MNWLKRIFGTSVVGDDVPGPSSADELPAVQVDVLETEKSIDPPPPGLPNRQAAQSTRPVAEPSLDPYKSDLQRQISGSSVSDHLIAFSRDYSGYVREAAIRRCVVLARPELLPAIADRLNDWVPQVREVARAAVLEMLPRLPATCVLDILPSVLGLSRALRTNHAEWLAQFVRGLVAAVGPNSLLDAVRGRDMQIARACFDILAANDLCAPSLLIDLALASRRDIVLSTHGFMLCGRLPLEQRIAVYGSGLRSHFGSVRALSIRALLTTEGFGDGESLAIKALLDNQSVARSAAMAYLSGRQFDVPRFYRAALGDPAMTMQQKCAALAALAGLHQSEDVSLVKSLLFSQSPVLRLAALSAWMKLAETDKDEIAGTALDDRAPRVRKFALFAVRRLGCYIPFHVVQATLERHGDQELLPVYASMLQLPSNIGPHAGWK